MSTARTREDFFRFLDYVGEMGLIPSATAASRKATANKVLAILSDDEASDITMLDLDPLMRRFQNKNPQQYTPESLQTYRSRMRTAIEDFRLYCENPIGFRPSGQAKTKSKPSTEKGKQEAGSKPGHLLEPTQPSILSPSLPNVTLLPIAIRSDVIVQIVNLPFDLTASEAQKIANIVLAHGG